MGLDSGCRRQRLELQLRPKLQLRLKLQQHLELKLACALEASLQQTTQARASGVGCCWALVSGRKIRLARIGLCVIGLEKSHELGTGGGGGVEGGSIAVSPLCHGVMFIYVCLWHFKQNLRSNG